VSLALAMKFDTYDKSNDRAAKEFLFNALSPSLKDHLKLSLEPSFPFALVWLRLVRLVTSTSIVQWDAIKKRIRGRLPSQYSGEDIIKLSIDFETDAKQLTIAGHYDHHLTSDMLRIFLLQARRGVSSDTSESELEVGGCSPRSHLHGKGGRALSPCWEAVALYRCVQKG
jgi:hypothetical protein